MNRITFKVLRMPDGWYGIVELPIMQGAKNPNGTLALSKAGQPAKALSVKTKTAAPSKGAAVKSAIDTALSVVDNPAVKALLPPGVGPALMAVKSIAKNPALQKAVKAGGRMAFNLISKAFKK